MSYLNRLKAICKDEEGTIRAALAHWGLEDSNEQYEINITFGYPWKYEEKPNINIPKDLPRSKYIIESLRIILSEWWDIKKKAIVEMEKDRYRAELKRRDKRREEIENFLIDLLGSKWENYRNFPLYKLNEIYIRLNPDCEEEFSYYGEPEDCLVMKDSILEMSNEEFLNNVGDRYENYYHRHRKYSCSTYVEVSSRNKNVLSLNID